MEDGLPGNLSQIHSHVETLDGRVGFHELFSSYPEQFIHCILFSFGGIEPIRRVSLGNDEAVTSRDGVSIRFHESKLVFGWFLPEQIVPAERALIVEGALDGGSEVGRGLAKGHGRDVHSLHTAILADAQDVELELRDLGEVTHPKLGVDLPIRSEVERRK
jgi:hypothetical protein